MGCDYRNIRRFDPVYTPQVARQAGGMSSPGFTQLAQGALLILPKLQSSQKYAAVVSSFIISLQTPYARAAWVPESPMPLHFETDVFLLPLPSSPFSILFLSENLTNVPSNGLYSRRQELKQRDPGTGWGPPSLCEVARH